MHYCLCPFFPDEAAMFSTVNADMLYELFYFWILCLVGLMTHSHGVSSVC